MLLFGPAQRVSSLNQVLALPQCCQWWLLAELMLVNVFRPRVPFYLLLPISRSSVYSCSARFVALFSPARSWKRELTVALINVSSISSLHAPPPPPPPLPPFSLYYHTQHLFFSGWGAPFLTCMYKHSCIVGSFSHAFEIFIASRRH